MAGEGKRERPRHAGPGLESADLFGEPAPPPETRKAKARIAHGERPGGTTETAVRVGELMRFAKDMVEGAFPPMWIRGEVSNLNVHRSGNWYFTLKDGDGCADCVVWSRDRYRIPAPPDEGMRVFVFGQLTIFMNRGRLQFTVRAIEAEGEGLWKKAFEKTRKALEADGLLDPARKRPLPRFPRRVGGIL